MRRTFDGVCGNRWEATQVESAQWHCLALGKFECEQIRASGLQRPRGPDHPAAHPSEISPTRLLRSVLDHLLSVDGQATAPYADQPKGVGSCLPGGKAASSTNRELLRVDSCGHLTKPGEFRFRLCFLPDGRTREIEIREIFDGKPMF